MRKRLKVLTVGCKANFADSASIARKAIAEGFEVVSPEDSADVVVINSCTVTHRADRDSRALARRARRDQPGSTVVMTGCFAEVSPEERGKVAEADHWVGIGDPGALGRLFKMIGGNRGEKAEVLSEYAANLLLGHRRTFLKIQDGCDYACSYCVVPRARGRNRSLAEADIVDRAVQAESEGARELVLTGIHIGLYGADRGEREGLASLVARLLASTARVRFRLGSVEPMELSGALIGVIAGEGRVCRHLHVPLQSGCDRTLARMRRAYDSSAYLEAVEKAVGRIPGAQIGADVIVGFPGETRGDFEETARFLADSPVHYLHVFPYSARTGTESAAWTDDVPQAEKKERVSLLRALDERNRAAFLNGQAGSVLEVLAEDASMGGKILSGHSDNYLNVSFPGGRDGVGGVFRVRTVSVEGKGLSGVAEGRVG